MAVGVANSLDSLGTWEYSEDSADWGSLEGDGP